LGSNRDTQKSTVSLFLLLLFRFFLEQNLPVLKVSLQAFNCFDMWLLPGRVLLLGVLPRTLLHRFGAFWPSLPAGMLDVASPEPRTLAFVGVAGGVVEVDAEEQ